METTMIQAGVSKFWHHLSKEPIVMFTDLFSQGLRCRPMAARAREDENAIWFLTDRDSAKIDEVRARPDVSLSIADTGANLYISVTGECRIIDDRAMIAELWSPADKIFFDGPDDPRIILLQVKPSEGQIWSGPSGIVAAIKMAFAIVTGTKADLGEARKVQL
jgi:general stress protein 26